MRKYFINTRLFFKTAVFFATVLYLTSSFSLNASADNESSDYGHYTILLSQIRGAECCDEGSVENYKFQIDALKKFDLVGNFSLRYDVLSDSAFMDLVKNDSKNYLEDMERIRNEKIQKEKIFID